LLSVVVDQQQATAPTVSAPAPSAYLYDIIDLGTGDGNWSCAHHINNTGQVLFAWGTARFPNELDPLITESHLLLSRPDSTIDLSTKGIDINDKGVVLGSTKGKYFLYLPSNAHVQVVPILGEQLWLTGINNAGALGGRIAENAVIIEAGRTTQLPIPPGYDGLRLDAIGDNGSAAGSAYIEFQLAIQRATLIIDGETTVLGPAPSADGSNSAAINDVGQLIGHPQRQGARAWVMPGRSFLYDYPTKTTTDLGSLPGYANSVAAAINNSGQVVGAAWAPRDQTEQFRRAFLYDHQTGIMTDLNTLVDPSLGWHLSSANDINDSGQIVGCGFINDETHAFLMTPNR
jgi:probable HAF family extracellular repeat protein